MHIIFIVDSSDNNIFFVNSEQTNCFKIGKFCLLVM